MAVSIKSEREIALMRESCKILAKVYEELEKAIRPGVTTKELDTLAEKLIRGYGCVPNFLNYNGFPGTICASVNEEVVHGIPSKNRVLKDGDIISIDCGCIYKGYHSDAARTYAVGNISAEVQQLMDVTKQAFFEGIKMAKAGNHLYDISNAIDDFVSPYGYGIVKDLVGHGIGTALHEDPQIPNFAQKKKGLKLCAGMTLAIEPMITMTKKGEKTYVHDDDWTVITADNCLSAHFEHTVAITDDGCEVLTLPADYP